MRRRPPARDRRSITSLSLRALLGLTLVLCWVSSARPAWAGTEAAFLQWAEGRGRRDQDAEAKKAVLGDVIRGSEQTSGKAYVIGFFGHGEIVIGGRLYSVGLGGVDQKDLVSELKRWGGRNELPYLIELPLTEDQQRLACESMDQIKEYSHFNDFGRERGRANCMGMPYNALRAAVPTLPKLKPWQFLPHAIARTLVAASKKDESLKDLRVIGKVRGPAADAALASMHGLAFGVFTPYIVVLKAVEVGARPFDGRARWRRRARVRIGRIVSRLQRQQ